MTSVAACSKVIPRGLRGSMPSSTALRRINDLVRASESVTSSNGPNPTSGRPPPNRIRWIYDFPLCPCRPSTARLRRPSGMSYKLFSRRPTPISAWRSCIVPMSVSCDSLSGSATTLTTGHLWVKHPARGVSGTTTSCDSLIVSSIINYLGLTFGRHARRRNAGCRRLPVCHEVRTFISRSVTSRCSLAFSSR